MIENNENLRIIVLVIIIIIIIIIIFFIENQPVNIKIIISIKIFCSINCKNSSTSLFTYIKSKIMVIVTISIRKKIFTTVNVDNKKKAKTEGVHVDRTVRCLK